MLQTDAVACSLSARLSLPPPTTAGNALRCVGLKSARKSLGPDFRWGLPLLLNAYDSTPVFLRNAPQECRLHAPVPVPIHPTIHLLAYRDPHDLQWSHIHACAQVKCQPMTFKDAYGASIDRWVLVRGSRLRGAVCVNNSCLGLAAVLKSAASPGKLPGSCY